MIGITDRSCENVGVLYKNESLDRNLLHLGKKVIILEISGEKYRKLKKIKNNRPPVLLKILCITEYVLMKLLINIHN
jgi:hypothetical protein